MEVLNHGENQQSESQHSCSAIAAKMNAEQEYFEAIVSNLSAERKKQGLSLHALADKIGCNLDLVAKWEARIRRPSAFLLYCWAESLDMVIEVKKRGQKKQRQRCAS